MDDISFGFSTREPMDAKYKWQWNGCWYKPWTWFRFEKVYLIREVTLLDISIVSKDND